MSGTLIECSKHNGRFDITDGSPRRPPVCVGLKTYQVREHEGKIFLDLNSAGGCGLSESITTYRFRVVSNANVATFIKELVLEPEPGSPFPDYQPGDYLQFDIPAYDEISFREIEVDAPYDAIWRAGNVFEFRAANRAARSAATSRSSPVPARIGNSASTSASARRRGAWIAAPASARPGCTG